MTSYLSRIKLAFEYKLYAINLIRILNNTTLDRNGFVDLAISDKTLRKISFLARIHGLTYKSNMTSAPR